ncbi:MAG TPA: hypothetical protein VNI78_09905 [Vicinamibacterales bacterium]|nr:hypothetical protein [Vicinamibacterales bacterium]
MSLADTRPCGWGPLFFFTAFGSTIDAFGKVFSVFAASRRIIAWKNKDTNTGSIGTPRVDAP